MLLESQVFAKRLLLKFFHQSFLSRDEYDRATGKFSQMSSLLTTFDSIPVMTFSTAPSTIQTVDITVEQKLFIIDLRRCIKVRKKVETMKFSSELRT